MNIIPILFFIFATGAAITPVGNNHDYYVCGKPPHHMSKKVLRKYLDACWQPSENIPSKDNKHMVGPDRPAPIPHSKKW